MKLLKRVYELILKMVGVKGLFAVLATVGLFSGFVPSWIFLLAWSLVIGAREVAKSAEMLRKGQGGQNGGQG